MKVIIVQPTIPSYRLGLFSRLADRLGSQLVVYASPGKLGVLTEHTPRAWERALGPICAVLPSLEWQPGALSIPLDRGDVLVVSGAPRCLSNIVLLLKARWKGVHTIWWGHYWSSTSRPWRAGLRMILMGFADAILFYTDREAEEYLATRKNNRKLVVGLNNGIETDEIVRLRKPYDPISRPRDLLFIGRLTRKAEFALLLEALALPACAGVTLDVIGEGDEEEALREQASALGLSGRVAWHGGTTDERQIAKIANRCKAFVYPGGVGLSLIHAFAYGLPAIVHDDRWKHMPEIAALRAGTNGLTFTKGSFPSLAGTIKALLGDHLALRRMATECVATTNRTFNAKDMADRFCGLICTSRRD